MSPTLSRGACLGYCLIVVVAIAACEHPAAITPPTIHYGEDACDFCRMTIDDARFAAALIYRAPAGRQRVAIFDDIGCMLAWQREHSSDRTITAFVHDYKTHQWIKASGAWYVRSSAIQTPMGWGIAAGASQTDAEQANPGSSLKAMDFSELWSAEKPGQGTMK
ncbi:MAG TPA: nitrous oxide reductase accessory protein NosL [Terriglobia bacterium]|nr:nitrous oxide reductase accessory protein NosL [Terriglobia bacterium]